MDNAFLDCIYRANYGHLLWVATGLTHGNFHVSEDLVQDAFASVAEHGVTGNGSIRYLLAMMVRDENSQRRRSWVQRGSRQELPFEPEHHPVATAEESDEVETVSALEERLPFLVDDDLLDAILELKQPQREAMLLSDIGELSHDHIAMLEGCTPNAIKQRVKDAHDSVRKFLVEKRGWDRPDRRGEKEEKSFSVHANRPRRSKDYVN